MFREPLTLMASRSEVWSVTSPDIQVSGHGASPEEALDDLVSAIVAAVGSIRNRRGSVNDPARAMFSRYIDLERPCPDPDVKRCGDG